MPDSPNHLNAATSVAASLLLVCGIAVCAHASVQDADPAPSAPSAEPAPSAESAEPAEEGGEIERTADPLPSLDELLGLEEEPTVAPPSQQETELERKLTAQDAADALQQALALMDDTASRLTQPGGTGLETQRLQEDIIRKLDAVIEAAQQNQGQGSGSSAGSQSQQSKPSNDPGKQQSGGAQAAPGQGGGDAAPMHGENTDAQLGPQQLLDASAWGSLPERLRDSVRQGLSDPFSAAYRAMTEAYYRRLAEEAEADR